MIANAIVANTVNEASAKKLFASAINATERVPRNIAIINAVLLVTNSPSSWSIFWRFRYKRNSSDMNASKTTRIAHVNPL